ncbi:MAG: 1-acyl-sn-glycerol-3-phosphate acyltransferase [Chloroflexi bacterium]|nr:1-acyl-sn-glycerol-3-phosphate acyltransferase [Chloroflexota bacterium]
MQTLLFWLSRPIIFLYARVMLSMDIFWHAPLPSGPQLIVANHPSFTDPFFVALVSSQPVKILIIVSAFLVPLFGRYLRLSGHVPVDPNKGREAFEKAKQLLEEGRSVVIFPEGDASPRYGGFRKPRTGVARLALLTGAPVVPVGIHLPRERLLTIHGTVAGKRSAGYWYLRGPYNMTVGQALRFEGDVQDRACVSSVSEKIMQRIITLADESEQRMEGRGSLPSTKKIRWRPKFRLHIPGKRRIQR